MKTYLMLACTIIKDEVLSAPAIGPFPIVFLPPDLHLYPDKLRAYIQEQLDRIWNVDAVLLPMGRCGNGTLGLKSDTAAIILPKCHDCIDLLLSRQDLFGERPQYTYFLTAGWLREANAIHCEYAAAVKKYGQEKADNVMKLIYANYRHFDFVNTGAYDMELSKEKILPLARAVRMEIGELEGQCSILHKMLRLEFDDNFIIVPPGIEVAAGHFD